MTPPRSDQSARYLRVTPGHCEILSGRDILDVIRREGEPEMAAPRRVWPPRTWGWIVCIWLLGVMTGAWIW